MKKLFGVVLGILIAAAGVLYALSSFNIISFDVSFNGWWTAFIIVPSIYGLITSKDKAGNLIALCVGICLLLAARDIIDYGMIWKLLLPAVIVLIGIKIVVKSLQGENPPE